MMKVPQRFVKLSLMSLVVVDVQAYLTDEILLNRDTKLTPPAVAAVAAAADRKCLVVKAEPERERTSAIERMRIGWGLTPSWMGGS